MDDLEIKELDISPLDPLIEDQQAKNGCTHALSGACCPVIYR